MIDGRDCVIMSGSEAEALIAFVDALASLRAQSAASRAASIRIAEAGANDDDSLIESGYGVLHFIRNVVEKRATE